MSLNNEELELRLWGEFLTESYTSVTEYQQYLATEPGIPDHLITELLKKAQEQAEAWGWDPLDCEITVED
jgi:hypothetical protein